MPPTAPDSDPLHYAIATLQIKHQDTKAKVDAAKAAEADFQANFDQFINQLKERFKL